eukprot:GHVT01026218.1.p1 GENE.GHVT01026218.1~~GHVT01026218.1.p1  ORF type:complete len:483 (-),score=109.51 GHVT01026218.1:392-1726(-)
MSAGGKKCVGKSTGLDYSSWDRWAREVSDDDEGEEEVSAGPLDVVKHSASASGSAADEVLITGGPNGSSGRTRQHPTLHKFDQPTRVTFGGAQPDAAPKAELVKGGGKLASLPASESTETDKLAGYVRNGGVRVGRYCWSQDRYAVTVHVCVPSWVTSRDVAVDVRREGVKVVVAPHGKGAPEFGRQATPQDERTRLATQSAGDEQPRRLVVFEGDWPHPIILEADPDDAEADGQDPPRRRRKEARAFDDWELKTIPVDWDVLVERATPAKQPATPQRLASESQTKCETAQLRAALTPGEAPRPPADGAKQADKGATNCSQTEGKGRHAADGQAQVDDARHTPRKEAVRFLILTLRKECGIADAHVWWPAPLKHEPEVDAQRLADRTVRPGSSSKSHSFLEAWKEAHALFREKVKTFPEPIEVDCSPNPHVHEEADEGGSAQKG